MKNMFIYIFTCIIHKPVTPLPDCQKTQSCFYVVFLFFKGTDSVFNFNTNLSQSEGVYSSPSLSEVSRKAERSCREGFLSQTEFICKAAVNSQKESLYVSAGASRRHRNTNPQQRRSYMKYKESVRPNIRAKSNEMISEGLLK